jgi:hypothetical protein
MGVMAHKTAHVSAFGLMLGAVLLSACGRDSKDEVMGQLITDCQLRAHSALEGSTLSDEKKHFALGLFVERCLKENGLQASNAASCFETPKSTEEGEGFIKPLQQCWKNTRSSKG